jgi:hypothetical protein
VAWKRLIYASDMEFTEVIKQRKMVRAFTGDPLAPGTADRLAVTDEGLGASFFGFDLRTLPGFRARFGVRASGCPSGLSPSATPIPAAIRSRPHGPVSGNPSVNWFTAATGEPHRMAALAVAVMTWPMVIRHVGGPGRMRPAR